MEEAVRVPAKVKDQLERVRQDGRTNMVDINGVQRVADDLGLYDLVVWCEDNRRTGKLGMGCLVGFEAEKEEEGTMDREKIQAAFRELEENGVSARGNFACCGSCGHAELGQENNQYAFWHEQEEDRAWGGYRGDELVQTLYIQFSDGSTARDATTTLSEHGLSASWTGDEGHCIEVRP